MKNPLKILIMLLIAVPLALGITGCSGGGVNGEGNGSYDTGTPIVRGNVYNDTGWEFISKGQYDSAIKHFNDVLVSNPTESDKAEAYNGIGWAKAFNGKLKDGMKYFQLASDLNDDAKVGLGAAYIQQASLADMEEAIEVLYVQLGKSKPRFNYVPSRQTSVTNAEVHAMLAYAFAATGDTEKSEEQLDYAKELEPNYSGKNIAQLFSAIEFLNNN
ncbi:MAG: tetratricopeptide repeat protein [Candidatus Riflebacteria bacterium]|nr:tetratricopeptide repeat protein [Candidatus Riflebacteria bacterium]